MTATRTTLDGLKAQRPEWTPWLSVVEAAVGDAANRAWDAAVPPGGDAAGAPAPFLAGKTVAVDADALHSLYRRLIGMARQIATPQMATLSRVAESDPVALFEASICQDTSAIAKTAADHGVDGDAFEAVIALLPVPFLQACNRRWAAYASLGWQEGHCSICGARPAFVEVRGIERTRVFRCARCGGGWHARPLRCPYCSVDDHNLLVSLVPEGGDAGAIVEACRSCLGYVKVFTRLQGCAPGAVMFDDLASVPLDVAALDHGYRRPQGPGYRLAISVGGNR